MFQTKVHLPATDLTISYQNRILTLGSCFAENIGTKMQELYFDTDINPFGVLYNPVSIRNSIQRLISNKPFTATDLFQSRGLWQSFSHSSLFADTRAEQCLTKMNGRFHQASDFLRRTDMLLITFGTAWIFEDRESGSVVSNCHKLPANRFTRRRLTVDEIVSDYTELINELIKTVPHIKLIFSVSPIRHWKNGAHENNLSKSILLLAIDQLQKKFENLQYFPAYEIMMDELRDYRFYASDMLHPSEVAVDYIWQKFSETYFDDKTRSMKKEFEQLFSDLSHRPLFPESEEFKLFQQHIEKRKAKLLSAYPWMSERIR